MGRKGILVLDEKQKADIASMSIREFCKKYGFSFNSACYLRRKYGICRELGRFKPHKEFIKDLRNLHLSQIAEKYGISISAVNYYRRKFGIKDYFRVRKYKVPIPPRDELEGLSIYDIMDRYKVCKATAISWLLKYDINPIRVRLHNYSRILKECSNLFFDFKIAFLMPIFDDDKLSYIFNVGKDEIKGIRDLYGIKVVNGLDKFFQYKKEGPYSLRKERRNLIIYFLNFYSDSEVARIFGLTREAVRQLKNKFSVKKFDFDEYLFDYFKGLIGKFDSINKEVVRSEET